MDRDQLKIMEKIVSAVKKTGVNVEYREYEKISVNKILL